MGRFKYGVAKEECISSVALATGEIVFWMR